MPRRHEGTQLSLYEVFFVSSCLRGSSTTVGAARATTAADATDIHTLPRALVDIDSTTGREGPAARWLADYLRSHGWSVLEQRVDATGFKVLAPPAGETPRAAR